MKPPLRRRARVVLSAAILWASLLGPALAKEREQDEASASHEVEFEYGVAYDTNAFLTPSDGYFDQNAGSVVDPVSVAGLFVPIRLDGLLTTRRSFVAYGLDGDLYPESDSRNAESFELRVASGLRFDFGGRRRDRTFEIGPFASQNKKVYFDRDTGLAGQSGGVDVSDRFEYRGVGGALDLEIEAGRALELSLEASAERRDYESVGGLESFDHDVLEAEIRADVRLGRPAVMYLSYGRQARLYDERHARDLDGDSSDANPLLEYVYEVREVGLRFRNDGRWRLSLAWERSDRTDEHVGYNDYVQDRYRLRQSFGGRRWKVDLLGGYRERTFPRAFIFDNPVSPQDGTPNPRKSYERIDYGFETEVAWNHFRLVIGADHDVQDTSDPRFTYRRTRTTLGGRWIF